MGEATSVSIVASGRQQNRNGAYGDVPMPADTCRAVLAPPLGRPFGAGGVQIAVGHQGALERQTQLAAVGVPASTNWYPSAANRSSTRV